VNHAVAGKMLAQDAAGGCLDLEGVGQGPQCGTQGEQEGVAVLALTHDGLGAHTFIHRRPAPLECLCRRTSLPGPSPAIAKAHAAARYITAFFTAGPQDGAGFAPLVASIPCPSTHASANFVAASIDLRPAA